MKTAMNRLENIVTLIQDLQHEINAFPRYEKELNHELLLKNKEATDIIHIIENIDLAPYEAIRVSERLHTVRKERRELKEQLTAITPLQSELMALLPLLKQKLQLCERQETYHQRNTAYQFRTVEGYRLLTEIVPAYQERSHVLLNSPDNFIPMNPKSPAPITAPARLPQVSAPAVKPVGAPVLSTKSYNQPDIAVEVNAPCKIVLNRHHWFIHSGSNVLCKETDLAQLVDKLFEWGLEHAGTNDQSRHVLAWNLKELKRKEIDRTKIDRYNHLLKNINK